MSDVKIFCRKCNVELTYDDHFNIDEYAFCITCFVNNYKEKLNKVIEALEYYACEKYYKNTEIDADGRGMHSMIEYDNGRMARDTLDEIKNGPIDLRGKKEEGQEEKQVEKK